MANPLSSATLEADHATMLVLRDLHGYTAVNPSYSVQTLAELEQKLTLAEQTTVRARKALAAARDAEVSAAREFHNAVLGAKNAVLAQYGNDSAEVQAIGLKRKSERKRAGRRSTKTTAVNQAK